MFDALDVTPYVVYFLGPFALAFGVRRLLALKSVTPFVVGATGFFAAWTCGVITTVITGVDEGSFAFTLVASTAAGVFEELSRFLGFTLIPASRGGPRPARAGRGRRGAAA